MSIENLISTTPPQNTMAALKRWMGQAGAGLLLLLAVLVVPAAAQTDFRSATNAEGTITITSYTGPGGNVTIPDTMGGRPIVSIGSAAFDGCSSLRQITLPNGLTNVGDGAFSYCLNLLSVVMPSNVTYLGAGAFQCCTSLTEIAIGGSLAAVGDSAFEGCGSLTSVTLGHGVRTIGKRAFFDTPLRSILIPDSVTTIGDAAFYRCWSLTNAIIGQSVITIGNAAFESCPSLVGATLPNSLTAMGDWAFSLCGLTNVTIPASVAAIGVGAFACCRSLSAINVDPNNRCFSSVDGVLFDANQATLLQCPGGVRGEVTIPAGVQSIGDWAFQGCWYLAALRIPRSVARIGFCAFWGTILGELWFEGNAPSLNDGPDEHYTANPLTYVLPESTGWKRLLAYSANPTIHHLPGTRGWEALDDLPTALWLLPSPVMLNCAPSSSGPTNAFGFTISWATNASVVVEAAATPSSPVWSPLATNSLTAGFAPFTDPDWSKYPSRFYRLRSL
jgi:hypothetical protein